MRDERVQFLDQRRDLDRHVARDTVDPPAAHLGDLQPQFAQGKQAVKGLQRRQHDQPEPEQQEAAHQCPAQHVDLRIEPAAALRDLKAPARLGARQRDVALDHAQFLVAELAAIIGVNAAIVVIGAVRELAVP